MWKFELESSVVGRCRRAHENVSMPIGLHASLKCRQALILDQLRPALQIERHLLLLRGQFDRQIRHASTVSGIGPGTISLIDVRRVTEAVEAVVAEEARDAVSTFVLGVS